VLGERALSPSAIAIEGLIMARVTSLSWGLALAGLAMAAPALSKTQPLASAPPPKIFQDVVQCRSITDAAQRLACFDQSVGVLATAQSNRDLYVADKDAMREARRGLFGFSVPKLRIFADDDMEKDVDSIETTVTSVSQAQRGYVFTLKDGARWGQTDGAYMDKPKSGSTIKIKRASLGSFFCAVGGHVGFRCERLNQ